MARAEAEVDGGCWPEEARWMGSDTRKDDRVVEYKIPVVKQIVENGCLARYRHSPTTASSGSSRASLAMSA